MEITLTSESWVECNQVDKPSFCKILQNFPFILDLGRLRSLRELVVVEICGKTMVRSLESILAGHVVQSLSP
jgi:hypothetical protein